MLEINYRSLSDFCNAFQRITHIKQIVIYDANKKQLFYNSYPREGGCPFYNIFKDIPALNKKCVNSDLEMFRSQHDKDNMNFIFSCPFGLTKVVIPIYDQELVGYIKFSRFVSVSNTDKIAYYIKNISSEYGINEKTLSDIYHDVKVLDYDKIKDMALIASTCLHSLVSNRVLYHKDTQLNEFLDNYIQQNINGDLSTPKICEYLHVSKSTLYKISLKHYNESINKHVEKLRLEYAKKLLCDEGYPLNIIAEKCGIPDANYFSKKFKKQYGVSPSVFRKNKKINETTCTS